jgi:hypothetical protein
MRTSTHANDAIAPATPLGAPTAPATVVCDVCGSTRVQELRCKVICRNCGTILQSCADL